MDDKIPNTLLSIQHQWPLIARDIVLMLYPSPGSKYTGEDIARNYNISNDDFLCLIKLPIFNDIVKTEIARFKSLGPDAGYKLRVEALVADIQERLYLRIKHGVMDDKSSIQFLEMLMKSIGADAPIQEDKPASSVTNTAVNISFNIPKLPHNRKLNHMLAQEQTNVIDYTG